MWSPQDRAEETARLERIEKQWERALPGLIRKERRELERRAA